MERAIEFPAKILSRDEPSEHNAGLFSIETVLNLEKLIFAGSPRHESRESYSRQNTNGNSDKGHPDSLIEYEL
jgi:hypothetical protein